MEFSLLKKYRVTCGFCGASWEQYGKIYSCLSCGAGYPARDKEFKVIEITPQKPQDQIDEWVILGQQNPWIKGAWDPPFDRNSFREAQTLEELRQFFLHGNWALGVAFYYQNLCFINQVNAGDEWLTIRDRLVFESISFGCLAEDREEFEAFMGRLLNAEEKALRDLTY